MYMENNDIRSLRDRAPEGCGCERGERERRQERTERAFCPLGNRRSCAGTRESDCSNYFITLGAPLAAVYSPIQVWRGVYSEAQALARGTLFADLDKPFMGKGRKCK